MLQSSPTWILVKREVDDFPRLGRSLLDQRHEGLLGCVILTASGSEVLVFLGLAFLCCRITTNKKAFGHQKNSLILRLCDVTSMHPRRAMMGNLMAAHVKSWIVIANKTTGQTER